MTEAQRVRRIQEALAAYQEQSEKETETLPWRGKQHLFPVIEIELDTILLNSHSHRLQAVLEDHPKRKLVAKDPWSDDAQEVIAEILRVRHADFAALKDSLRLEGQRDPGVITRKGVLLNANTRAVALRDLNDPDKRWIRAAVLPADAEPKELTGLETALQVQDPLKDEYKLTEQLLLVEEKSREHGMSAKEIALELRWASDDGRSLVKGAERVNQYRRILALVREMQEIPTPRLPLTFFDDKLEQLKALEKKYNAMLDDDPVAAREYRDNWLAAALAGASSVHLLRAVDEDFAGEFLLPRLEESDELGDEAEELLSADRSGDGPAPPGVEELGEDSEPEEEPAVGVRPLLNVLASKDPTVTLPGSDEARDRAAVKEAIERATKAAIRDRRAADKAENELDEPITHARAAAKHLRQAEEAFRTVRRDSEFDQRRRGQFHYQLKQVTKGLNSLQKVVDEEE